MASAELERSHSAMGSLAAGDKTSPSKSPTKTATTVLERSASSSSGSSVAVNINNNNELLKRPPIISASERLQEHRSRMHRHASQRRPLTSTTSVDGSAARSMGEAARSTSSLDVPTVTASSSSSAAGGGGGRGPRATSPFVESSREAAEVRLRVLAEIKALQVRRNDSFKRGSPVLSGGARVPRQPRVKIDEGKLG